MRQFMIVAVTKPYAEKSHYHEVGLFDGEFGFRDNKYRIWKAVSYANGIENPFLKEMVSLVVDEKGSEHGDFVLEYSYDFIWGDNKKEIINKFLHHDFEPLF